MNPTLGQVHSDQPLTQISIAAFNADDAFVAQKAFPRVPVKKESDKYYIYTKSYLFRSKTEVRAAGAPVALRDYKVSTATYTAEEYAVGMMIPDRIKDNADDPLQPLNDGAKILAHDMKMFIENNWASTALVTGAWTSESTQSGTDQWDDYTNSDPVGDVDTAKETVNGLTGVMESEMSMICGLQVWNKLKRHPQLIAAIGGGATGVTVLNKSQVAEIFGLKSIMVAEAVRNTNNEGNSTQTLSRIVGKLAWIGYVTASPSLMAPSGGYFFSKTVAENYRYYAQRRRSEVIELSSLFDFKITMADAGYLYIDAVS